MKKYLILILLISCTATKPQTRVLDGSKSFDPDGWIASWKWRQVSGSKAVIYNDTAKITTVRITGDAVFELKGVDNQGAVGKRTILIKK